MKKLFSVGLYLMILGIAYLLSKLFAMDFYHTLVVLSVGLLASVTVDIWDMQ